MPVRPENPIAAAFRPVRAVWILAGAAAFISPHAPGQEVWARAGLDGLAVTALAAGPAGSTLYAGTAGGAVYRSDDGGNLWTEASAGLPPARVRALAVDPFEELRVYAGTEQGLFRSLDGGGAWSFCAEAAGAVVFAIAVDPANPARVWVSTDDPGLLHLFASADRGEHWEPVTIRGPRFGTPNFQFALTLEIDPATSRVHAGWHEIVFFSDDAGGVWDLYPDLNHEVTVFRLDPFDRAVGYAGTADAGAAVSVGGAPWTFGQGLESARVLDLAPDPGNPGLLWAATGDGRLVRSRDRGAAWSGLPDLPETPFALLAGAADGRLRVGTSGGVLRLSSAAEPAPRLEIETAPRPGGPISLPPRGAASPEGPSVRSARPAPPATLPPPPARGTPPSRRTPAPR